MQRVTSHQNRIAQLLGGPEPKPLAEFQLEQAGVILTGHFRLRGNQHSSRYVRFTREFFESDAGKSTLGLFLNQLQKSQIIPLKEVEVVVGPQTCGGILAKLLAEDLSLLFSRGVQAVTVVKNPEEDPIYRLLAEDASRMDGRRVLVVDDVWNTGITLAGNVIPILKQAGARVIGAAVLANRGNACMPPFCPFEEYWRIAESDCYPARPCPLCEQDIPITQF